MTPNRHTRKPLGGDDADGADGADGAPSHPRLARIEGSTRAVASIVAIGSLPILILELQLDELVRQDRMLVHSVNLVVLVVFTANYCLGMTLADSRRQFVRREWLQLLLVISQALVFVPSLGALGFLRSIRLTRYVRVVSSLLRIVAIGGIASREGRRILRERATSFALGLASMTWITSAVGFTMAEDVGPDGRLDSFFDALWWSLSTITTVGYGDVYPVTAAGRMIGGVTMVIGISVFAIVTAKVAEFFTRDEPPT